jgi:ABC-type multidrug transport system fused ATPase/permease subunit
MELSAKMRKSPQILGTSTASLLAYVELELRNISFAYPASQSPVLQDFSLKISRGETLLIKGPSGVGKSTLLALLTGMIKSDRGDILLNGSIRENLLEELSNSIGYVGPEPYMVSGSVRDNLLYGLTPERKARVGEEKLAWAMKLANVSDFVAALPEGLATQLREHTQLSSGQKQRLAICRALLRDPQLMVFDEATANLDFETERGLIEELARFTFPRQADREGLCRMAQAGREHVLRYHTYQALRDYLLTETLDMARIGSQV